MLSETDLRQSKEDTERIKTWFRGDKIHPCVTPCRKAYPISTVLFPNLVSHIRYHLSYLVMWLISLIPWSSVKIFFYRRMGVRIGKGVYIAPWVFLDGMYPHLIELEDGCHLGGGCTILTHEKTTDSFRIGRVRIGTDSVIGAFSIIRCGISVGSNVTTGIGSVVLKDIPNDRVAIGNPARLSLPNRNKDSLCQ
jgi:acetyltransferase-like isoleucine patch superfamily enzyme